MQRKNRINFVSICCTSLLSFGIASLALGIVSKVKSARQTFAIVLVDCKRLGLSLAKSNVLSVSDFNAGNVMVCYLENSKLHCAIQEEGKQARVWSFNKVKREKPNLVIGFSDTGDSVSILQPIGTVLFNTLEMDQKNYVLYNRSCLGKLVDEHLADPPPKEPNAQHN